MKKYVYDLLPDLEENNWWYKGRKKILINLFKKYFSSKKKYRILDLGCGAGSTMELLRKYGEVIGIDNNRRMVQYCRRKNKKVFLADAINLPFENNYFDIVIALEILEHIKNDNLAIKEIKRVLKKGGVLILSVPAFSFLFGPHDISACHFRRYNPKILKKKLEKNNFKIIKKTFINFWLFLPIVIFRLLRKLVRKIGKGESESLDSLFFNNNKIMSNLLTLILTTESVLIDLNLPFGVTLLLIAINE